MIKLKNISYDIEKIWNEILILVENHTWGDRNQLSLQSPDGSFFTGDGKIEWHDGYEETDFIKTNTPDDWEITRFIKENNLYRTRIMKLMPRKCYSYHWDRTPRVHLAVKTREDCFITVDDVLTHIPADGYAYWIDTRKNHTAMNCSGDFERVHIVGCTQMTLE